MNVQQGDVIQIIPAHEWGGCFAIVNEVKPYGCQAYVVTLKDGTAYVNLMSNQYKYIGVAAFVIE